MINRRLEETIDEVIANNLKGQEDFVAKILEKFELLLNKEEYYHHQERVYKLNKALCAINKAKNVSVSNFIEDLDSEVNGSKKSPLKFNLEALSSLLDELIKEKESGVTDANYNGVITSSSDESEEGLNLKIEPHVSLSNRRRSFVRNLYNYELILKTYLHEKTLNEDKMMLDEVPEDLNESTHNITAPHDVSNDNFFMCATPLSKIPQDAENSAKSSNFTPMIKKSFFEDKETKTMLKNRRRSYIEEPKMNLDTLSHLRMRRKSYNVEHLAKHCHSHSNKRNKSGMKSSEEKKDNMITDDTEISQFNIQLPKDQNTSSSNNSNSNDSFQNGGGNRGSIFFRDRDFLDNIVENENEDYYNNMSVDYGSEEEQL